MRALWLVLLAGCGPVATVPTVPDAGVDGVDASVVVVDAGDGFVRFPEYVPSGPLCVFPPGWVPDGGRAATFIGCDVASGRFSTADPSLAPATLKVVAWNVEFGAHHADVLDSLKNRPELKAADVLLLSEVARDSLTSRPARLDQARALAQALGMDYLFAVEWDRRELPAEQGEHGVAILSKYPLGNVRQVRHTPLNDWWKEDKLYGGRISLGADVWVRGQRLRVYASHLCTRGGEAGRATQAAELRADAADAGLAIAGGDLNTFLCNPVLGTNCTVAPGAEQAVEDFEADGWSDATAGFNGTTQLGKGVLPQRLDWLFARGLTVVPGGGADASAKGSDHLPLSAQVTVPSSH